MGGAPRACAINLGIRGVQVRRFRPPVSGSGAAARAAAVDIVGGSITHATQPTITIALLGELTARPCAATRPEGGKFCDRHAGRHRAGMADGRAACGGRAARKFHRPSARRKPVSPPAASFPGCARCPPRSIWRRLAAGPQPILERSGVGAEVDLAAFRARPLPEGSAGQHRPALSGGEDYELLFCLPHGHSPAR